LEEKEITIDKLAGECDDNQLMRMLADGNKQALTDAGRWKQAGFDRAYEKVSG